MSKPQRCFIKYINCKQLVKFEFPLAADCQGELSWEVPRFDGWYNSLAHPERGAVGKSHAAGGDGRRSSLHHSNPLHLKLCARARFSSRAPRARALLGRSLPTGARAGAAERSRAEQAAGRGPFRSALSTQPYRAVSVLW